MPLMELILTLVVVGVVLWAINSYIPMQDPIKKILNIVVVVVVIIWLCSLFGVFGHFPAIRVGR
jgi:hypothetical protein